jgi:16S rRNA (guanine966-N2)-methyltransferase
MISNLQIISGKHRGRRLALPPGARPTQNRARAALFNMLGSLGIEPKTVWDAFAGSGAVGLEFLSRYENANVIFTDVSIDAVRKNLFADATVSQTDAIAAIEKYGAISDLIFIDPPFADGALAPAFIRKLTPVAKPGAILVAEMESGQAPVVPESWKILRDKTYGRARFLILQKT